MWKSADSENVNNQWQFPKNSQRFPKEFPKEYPKNSHKKKEKKEKKNPKEFPKNYHYFENIQLPTSHLETKKLVSLIPCSETCITIVKIRKYDS